MISYQVDQKQKQSELWQKIAEHLNHSQCAFAHLSLRMQQKRRKKEVDLMEMEKRPMCVAAAAAT